MQKKQKNNRLKSIGRSVVAIALATAVALSEGMAMHVQAVASFEVKEAYEEATDDAVIDITFSEYKQLLCMTMAESGYMSEEMMNGCANAAINQCIRNECSMEETLNRPGAFGNGKHMFRDEEGVWREVEISDVNHSVVEQVNDALHGIDVTEEIGGCIGFYAPEYCSEKTKAYFKKHIRDTMQIENVVFFARWE